MSRKVSRTPNQIIAWKPTQFPTSRVSERMPAMTTNTQDDDEDEETTTDNEKLERLKNRYKAAQSGTATGDACGN